MRDAEGGARRVSLSPDGKGPSGQCGVERGRGELDGDQEGDILEYGRELSGSGGKL